MIAGVLNIVPLEYTLSCLRIHPSDDEDEDERGHTNKHLDDDGGESSNKILAVSCSCHPSIVEEHKLKCEILTLLNAGILIGKEIPALLLSPSILTIWIAPN